MHPAVIQREVDATLALMRTRGWSLAEATDHCMKQLVQMKGSDDLEPWAEDAVQLSLIESLASLAMRGMWRQLRDRVIKLLGLSAADELFAFNPEDIVMLISEGELFTRATAAPTGPLTNAQVSAWTRGGRNAAANLSLEWNSDAVQRAIRDQLARVRESYAQRGLSLVRGGVARTFQGPIVGALASGEFDGQNPVHVARQLRQRFGNAEYNWERLARSETAFAQVEGKKALMQAQGIEKYNYVTANDAKVSRICRALEAGGPYLVASPQSPLPMRDSHPNCRCTTTPVLPD